MGRLPWALTINSAQSRRASSPTLFVVRGNPLDDIKTARAIKVVVKDGVVYDAAELLQSAEGKIGPEGPHDHADWRLEIRPLLRK